MENLLRNIVFMLLVFLAAALAAAQGWNGSEGSSIVRVTPLGVNSLYDRPGLYFLGRPAKVLPPPYAFAAPYGISRVVVGSGYIVREFGRSDSGATATLVSRRMALREVPHRRGKALTNRLKR